MSIVLPLDTGDVLRDHVGRLRPLERSGSLWIFVGTVGVDGVDDLLSPDSPPFENAWTNSLGDDAPVSFTRINGWVHIRGGFTGGPDATTIFTLPDGYRPEYAQPMIIPTNDGLHYATVIVQPTGPVVYIGQV